MQINRTRSRSPINIAFSAAGAFLLTTLAVAGAAAQKSASAFVITVQGSQRRPVAGARIQINAPQGSFKLDGITNQEGAYRAPSLDPGDYGITVTAPCFEKFTTEFKVTSVRAPTQLVILTPAATESSCDASGFKFADSSALKASEIVGAVDAAGYSSQAEARTPEMSDALADVLANGKTQEPAQSKILSSGQTLLRQSHYPEAAGIFRGGTSSYPGSATMFLALGVAYYAGGHDDEAIGALCKAADLDPGDRRSYFFLAHAAGSSKAESDLALRYLLANANSHPHDAAAQYEYAIALLRSENLGFVHHDNEAERFLHAAINLDDSFAAAHFELGSALSANLPSMAAKEFERVIALQPDWAEAHYRLAQLEKRAGAEAASRDELAEYERLHRAGSIDSEMRLLQELRQLNLKIR